MNHIEKAESLQRAERYAEALAAYEAAAANPATRAGALGRRAWLLRYLGRYEEAVRDYAALLEITPEDDHARTLLADTRHRAGETREALAEAVLLLRRNHLNRAAAEVLVRCQEALGATAGKPYEFRPHEPVRPISPTLDLLESEPASFPASVFPPVGRFLYTLMRLIRPRMALEVGCFVGYSSICIAQAMEENGFGHLHSFDLFMHRPDLQSPVAGECADSLVVARAHLQHAGLAHRVNFHKGDSAPEIRRLFGEGKEMFDFAFIDGDHTIQGCLADWRAVDELLADGGVVLLHDTMPEKCGWAGPRHLLEQLRTHEASSYQWVNLPSPEGYGMALVQKLRPGAANAWSPGLGELLREWKFMRRVAPRHGPGLLEVIRRRT
jgi:predicted O-methyltransferase YrrM